MTTKPAAACSCRPIHTTATVILVLALFLDVKVVSAAFICNNSLNKLHFSFGQQFSTRLKQKSWQDNGDALDHQQEFFDLHHHHAVDDDDISQETFMIKDDEQRSKQRGSYRRIEDWHADQTPKADEVLQHLKREKARWSKIFDSLGGGGI